MNKIALIGTHSGGKTTSLYAVAAYLKRNKHTVNIVPEVAREALHKGFKLDKDASQDGQEYMLHAQMSNELEGAIDPVEYLICDRSVKDGLAYVLASYGYGELYHYLAQTADQYARRHPYQLMLYYPPLEDKPQFDGVRNTDSEYQLAIHNAFMELIERGVINAHVLKNNSKNERVEEAINIIRDKFGV